MSRWAQARREVAKRRNVIVAGVSAAGHMLVLLALLSAHVDPVRPFEIQPMTVELVDLQPPSDPVTPLAPSEPAPAPPSVEKPSPVKPPPRNRFRETPAPPDVDPLPAGEGPAADSVAELSDAQISGAATAGSGQAGGACNMPRWLQAALRKDALVQAAVSEAHRGKAMLVWNGDWIRHGSQEGNGLAAVREAIMWEVAFAPEACRAQPVHGLVLISLGDAPGSARLVVGSADWHWSDLLFQRRAASDNRVSQR